jgi:hypothetical protein
MAAPTSAFALEEKAKEMGVEKAALEQIDSELDRLWESLDVEDLTVKTNKVFEVYKNVLELSEKIENKEVKEKVEEILETLKRIDKEIEKLTDLHLDLRYLISFY